MSGHFTSLRRYLPLLLTGRMAERTTPLENPERETFPATVLFADISGFTALTEKMTRNNPEGSDALIDILDNYLGRLIDIIIEWGGDIVKFAGDAVFAVWKVPEHETLADMTYRASRCAMDIQDHLHQFEVAPGVRLSLKISLGAGEIHSLLLGGTFDRWELVLMGHPMVQVGLGGNRSGPGEVVISPQAWKILQQHGVGHANGNGRFKLKKSYRTPARFMPQPPKVVQEAEAVLLNLIPRAILTLVNDRTGVASGLHRITVIFLNVRDLNFNTPLDEMQQIMAVMQSCLYRYHGSINRFGVDDKGAVLLAGFGLPPFQGTDDPEQAVMAALDLHRELSKLGRKCTIGITTGKVFCGPVGNERRSEYTVHGAKVNLAARLMMAAETILCDAATYITATNLPFDFMPPLVVKGRKDPVEVFRPVEPDADSVADSVLPKSN